MAGLIHPTDRVYHFALNTMTDADFLTATGIDKWNFVISDDESYIIYFNDSAIPEPTFTEVTSPPAYMTKTENMTKEEAEAIVSNVGYQA